MPTERIKICFVLNSPVWEAPKTDPGISPQYRPFAFRGFVDFFNAAGEYARVSFRMGLRSKSGLLLSCPKPDMDMAISPGLSNSGSPCDF